MAKIVVVEPGPHEWLKSTQIIVLWLKPSKTCLGHFLTYFDGFFEPKKISTFFRIFKVIVQDFGSGSKFSSSTKRHPKCLKLPQTCQNTLLGRIDLKKVAEHQYQRQVDNSSFGPIPWQTRISRKSAFWLIGPQNPISRFDHKNTFRLVFSVEHD